jgi:hypothetical protein
MNIKIKGTGKGICAKISNGGQANTKENGTGDLLYKYGY